MRIFIFIIAAILMLLSCVEEKIVEVEVEKEYSWQELTMFDRMDNVFINSGHGDNAIYFQQPGHFTSISNVNGQTEIVRYIAEDICPTDIQIKLPRSNTYFASLFWDYDTYIRLSKVNHFVSRDLSKTIDIKSLDSSATKITGGYLNEELMVISDNDVLLLHYLNDRPDDAITFMLIAVSEGANSFAPIDTQFSKKVIIPKLTMETKLRYFAAIDDFFMVDMGESGLFKLKEDGTFYNVIDGYVSLNTMYKFKDKIYAHGIPNKLFISSDNGETWSEKGGIDNSMIWADYNSVADSLIGSWMDNIFVQTFIDDNNYTLRFLKNDGLEHKYITGIEVLADTVYIATYSGLYKKPVSTFFETK